MNSKSPKEDDTSIKTDNEDVLFYCKNNYRDIIVYVLFVIGLVLFFFNPLYGGIIMGLILGVYFGSEVLAYLAYCKVNVTPQDLLRHLILGGTVLAFFISVPSIFFGLAAAIILKEIFIVKPKN